MSEPGTEPSKTLLIIKSNASAISTAENFLRNRGWNIFSTSNLKEALIQLVQHKPTYVLISVDHPNKKVRGLPKILNQAFPVAVIAFAENQNSASYKLLNDAATEYRVYPPVTGPAIERCVNKYLKDQQTRETMQNASSEFRSSVGDAKDNGTISIKGGESSQAFSSDNVNRLLSQFLGEDTSAQSIGGSAKNDSSVIFARAVDDEAPNASSGTVNPESAQQGDLSNPHAFGKTSVQKGSTGNIGTYVPPVSSETDGLAAKPGSPEDLEPKGSREYRRQQKAKQSTWGPAVVPEMSTDDRLKARRAQSEANQTLIARGTQMSLQESVKTSDAGVQQKIQDSSNMACIVVESPRFSGYLVAVMGNNRVVDGQFITLIKKRLFHFLKENGEDVNNDDEAMGLKIKQVDFEPWALEYADFLRKSVHEGNEVAMAFFPRRPIEQILEDSSHHEMAKIQLAHLKGDTPVEFDLYMHFPANNKYVLYTPKGGVFYNKQLERLKKQGITHMHVQKTAAQAINRYQAQNYLNDLVDDHGQKQSLTSKAS